MYELVNNKYNRSHLMTFKIKLFNSKFMMRLIYFGPDIPIYFLDLEVLCMYIHRYMFYGEHYR